MQPQKSLGPADGIRVCSFQRFWHIVGEDVVLFSLKVLNEGLDITAINQTHIALAPKLTSPL